MKNLIILLTSLFIVSCLKTDIINYTPEPVDTVMVQKRQKPHKPFNPPTIDSTDVNDTTREPMGWNPTVEDWEEADTVNVKSNFN